MYSVTPGPQSQENFFSSGSSFEDLPDSTARSRIGNMGTDTFVQSSFSNGGRGFSNMSNQGFRQDQSSHSAYLVTKILSRDDLDDERRSQAHDFHTADEDIKFTSLYSKGLALDTKLNTVLQRLSDQSKEVSAVRLLVNATWALTAAQQSLLRDLLQYYLIKPTTSYRNIIPNAEAYIATHRLKYHLENYSTEDIVKKTINMFLVKALVAVKSKYRKKLFKLVSAHLTLDTLSSTLVQQFHMSPRPTVIGNGILSTVALQRRVARPLAAKKNKKGADTGFWTDMNTEMPISYFTDGTDRKDAQWLKWEGDIISSDRAEFFEDVNIPSDEEEEGEDGLPPDS
ncbi:hypothetical protein HWV62_20750 [Athelia sp. TMB]|nr:hypothetical protein HWV62_20750 [Athelia sp. TMB]